MCGFAGIVNFASADPPAITEDLLRRMGAPVAHRGPDGCGTFISPDRRVGLIHHRLAVVDLPGGAQPMCNEDSSVWVVFNGEIYNHVELRAELARAGHRFTTDHCDTEVIVHAYEQYGADCPKHLRGQFAFAVVDLNRKSVLLARDRLGQKPLYDCILSDETILFGSSMHCLLANGRFEGQVDVHRLCDYLCFGYVPPMGSMWQYHTPLPAGACRLYHGDKPVTGDRRDPQLLHYWVSPYLRFTGSPGQAVGQVRDRLIEATELRLRADVEVGCFLSGGTDSAVVASIVRRVLNRPIRTFTIGTPDPAYDEREPARRVAKELGAEHVELEVQPDHLLDVLDDLVETVAEPFADSSIIPAYWVARLTRPHVKVALSGDGGDEAFAGYDRYRAIWWAHRLRWTRPFWRMTWPIWRMLGGASHRDVRTRVRRFVDGLRHPLPEMYQSWVGLFDEAQTSKILRRHDPRIWRLRVRCVFSELDDYPVEPGDVVDAAIRTDYQTYLPGDILTKVDRSSMRVALEVRSPFLDHKVVELAVSLPSRWKLHGRTSKWILREAFKDIVPASVWGRPKRGFALPLDRWFRGELLGLLRESVAFLPAEVFNHAYIDELIAAHAAGRAEHSQRLWALLWLGRWWRRFGTPL